MSTLQRLADRGLVKPPRWRLFEDERPRRVKPLLYAYRVLLTGIHLMRTGEVEANLVRLNEEARLGHVDDLVARKRTGPERSALDEGDAAFHRGENERLVADLEAAYRASDLPEGPTARSALNDLLVRLRMRTTGSDSGSSAYRLDCAQWRSGEPAPAPEDVPLKVKGRRPR